jgi:hypothetical protein
MRIMLRTVKSLSIAVTLAAVVLVGAVGASARAGGYHPRIDPAEFTTTIDNPWYPLTPGTITTFAGVEGGKPSRDVVTVTTHTKRILGVDTVVVQDDVSIAGRVEESTRDYFAQDSRGNVWYFGEDTKTLDRHGRVTSREGTWHAGVGGGQPGIIMEANPVVGKRLRQEYLKGHAEDWYRVVSLAEPATVPFGSFSDALVTSEWSTLEPGVRDRKVYARGIGVVSEATVKGPNDHQELISVQPPPAR